MRKIAIFLGMAMLWASPVSLAQTAAYPGNDEELTIDKNRGGWSIESLVDHSSKLLQFIATDPQAAQIKVDLSQSQTVLLFPQMSRIALGFGTQNGYGLMMRKLPDQSWSAPMFMVLSFPQLGLQLGYGTSDIVIMAGAPDSAQRLADGEIALNFEGGGQWGDSGTIRRLETLSFNDRIVMHQIPRSGAVFGIAAGVINLKIDDPWNLTKYQKANLPILEQPLSSQTWAKSLDLYLPKP